MSFWNEKIKPHLEGHHKLIIALVLLAVLAGAAYYFRLDIKDKVIKAKPQPIQSMELANTNFALQAINSPKLNVQEIDRVSAFFVKNGHVFFSMRNPDGSETQVEAFDLKDGALVPYRGFGKDGILTIKEKMVFGMTVDSDNNVYYVKKGVHALISGNDIASLQGSTTATRIAFLPGERQAYLYGNDNFTLADVKDGDLRTIILPSSTTVLIPLRAALPWSRSWTMGRSTAADGSSQMDSTLLVPLSRMAN